MKELDEMAIFDGYNVYEKLGVAPLINAAGTSTNIGGSNPSDRVMQAMLDANRNFVDMGDLLDKSGEYIAEQLGVEAAYPTSGGAAALVLSAAACIAGTDQTLIGELPETGIKKNCDILIKNEKILEVVIEGTTVKILLKKHNNNYIGKFKEMEFISTGN